MAKGIVRNLDELGRITLPKEIRIRYEINAGDRLGINLDGKTIRISKTVTGMSRPMDELGRVTVPKEYRRVLDIADGAPVDIWVDNGEICIAKFDQSCIICGSSEQLMEVKGIHICYGCAAKVISKFSEV